MIWNRLKYVALAALVALSLAGLGIRQWVSASDEPGAGRKAPSDEKEAGARKGREAARPDDGRPGVPGRRREAVIRLPLGTYIKEIDAAPYGSGRLTWTYEEERVLGLVEGSVMGVDFELATEAEYSLSSNGTIYGLLTGVRLNHLRLPQSDEFAELQKFVGLWPAIEPLVNEVMTDLPFSYQFRTQGERLTISNYRLLLAGPNPLGKLGVYAAQSQGGGSFEFLLYFQALGTAIEGTYTNADAKEKPARTKQSLFLKPHGKFSTKKK